MAASLRAGMISESAVRLRVDDWPSPTVWLRSDPPVRHPEELFVLVPVGAPARPGTWILDIEGLAAGTTYTFTIDGASPIDGTVKIRTPPRGLVDGSLEIAVLSCYFPSDEYKSNPDRVVGCLDLRAAARRDDGVPHLKVFCGDQIYADVPWSWSSEGPTELYSRIYRDAWARGQLGALVSRGANVFVPEDHEFWNGFPDEMFHLARSGRTEWFDWATAAADAAWVEQSLWNFAPAFRGNPKSRRGWGHTALAGVDMFVADTRTDRVSLDYARCFFDTSTLGAHPSDSPRSMMGVEQLDALTTWADTVDRIGIIVLGQPLLARSTGPWTFDTTLADYEADYAAIVTAVRRNIEQRGISFVVLTGDIHWGRLVYWSPRVTPSGRPHAKLVEFVASPIARVGGIKSLLSRQHDVGKPVETTIEDADRRLLRRCLPEFTEERVFATGENNFGMFTLTASDAEHREATFELWSLTTLAHARNEWNPALSCLHERLEL